MQLVHTRTRATTIAAMAALSVAGFGIASAAPQSADAYPNNGKNSACRVAAERYDYWSTQTWHAYQFDMSKFNGYRLKMNSARDSLYVGDCPGLRGRPWMSRGGVEYT